MIRGHAGEPAYVLVLKTLGAPVRKRRPGRRRPDHEHALPQPAPAEVTTTRATLVGASQLGAPGADWLRDADIELEARTAIAVIDSVVHLHRSASADACVPVVTRERALVVRVGYGAGEQVADGRWTDAVTVAEAAAGRRERSGVLRPQERLAAILGGRDVALACEELTLRARLDADAGRWREAAFQMRVALEATIAELGPWSGQADIAQRIAELRDQRGPVGDAANGALEGGLDDERIAAISHALERVEAALRTRTHIELGG